MSWASLAEAHAARTALTAKALAEARERPPQPPPDLRPDDPPHPLETPEQVFERVARVAPKPRPPRKR